MNCVSRERGYQVDANYHRCSTLPNMSCASNRFSTACWYPSTCNRPPLPPVRREILAGAAGVEVAVNRTPRAPPPALAVTLVIIALPILTPPSAPTPLIPVHKISTPANRTWLEPLLFTFSFFFFFFLTLSKNQITAAWRIFLSSDEDVHVVNAIYCIAEFIDVRFFHLLEREVA